MFIAIGILIVISFFIILYIISNSCKFHDTLGLFQFKSIWKKECTLAKQNNTKPDLITAMFLYAMQLYKNDIKKCDEVMKLIIDNGGMLLYNEISTHDLLNGIIRDRKTSLKLEMNANIYPVDPQLVLYIFLHDTSKGNLAYQYAKKLLNFKLKPWMYRI